MLDRVSSIVLGLDGQGGVETFADYSQWEIWQGTRSQSPLAKDTERQTSATRNVQPAKKKLSYLEAREYAAIEQRIADAEEVLREKRTHTEDPAIASDAEQLVIAHADLEQAQRELDALYQRWAELEGKQQA
jgi:ATP-binding cassette subfamily F protein uup